MNRRGFLRCALGAAGAAFGFSILPPALTYQRVWRVIAVSAEPEWLSLPADMNIQWEVKGVELFASPLRLRHEGPSLRYRLAEGGIWIRCDV